ncbi:MAG: type II secretion system minor pseudopilin GspK [Nitrospinae bacterium]|nr:type II secretion system minor pseudopilin GspK [Nitrospinota bacterium]
MMVMWALVLLAVFAAELALSARSDRSTVRNFKEDRQAYFIAKAGVEMAFNEILADFDFTYVADGQLVLAKNGEENAEYAPRNGILIGGGALSYTIRDENGKLNLNALARDGARLQTVFGLLFPEGLEGVDAAVDSIQDWVDADDLHRANGAESDFYQTRQNPHKARNADFDSLDELRKVNGVTPEMFARLSPIVSLYPGGALNVNTAPETVLLAQGLPADQVAVIMKVREEKGYSDATGQSDIFEITSSGSFEGSPLVHTIRVYVRKTGPRSLRVLDWIDSYYPVKKEEIQEEKKKG